jgi:hypothetical protein
MDWGMAQTYRVDMGIDMDMDMDMNLELDLYLALYLDMAGFLKITKARNSTKLAVGFQIKS